MASIELHRPLARNVHPGEILAAEIQERGISQKELAERTGIQASHLSELINGKRDLSMSMAIALERELGISFEFWVSLQANYDYAVCLAKEKANAKKTEGSLRNLVHGYNTSDREPLALHESSYSPKRTHQVSDLIRDSLVRLDISQKELAEFVGVSPSRINEFVNGRALPNLDQAGKICRMLDIPASDMLGI